MTKKEIKSALKQGKKMKWDDPDPILGNDYTIHEISDMDDETCYIQYGGVNEHHSEAEVYLSEISLK